MNELTQLTADVKANTDVIKSALVLIRGFNARLDAAIAAALAAGATPEVLAQLTAFSAEIAGVDVELATAVAENTVVVPEPAV